MNDDRRLIENYLPIRAIHRAQRAGKSAPTCLPCCAAARHRQGRHESARGILARLKEAPASIAQIASFRPVRLK